MIQQCWIALNSLVCSGESARYNIKRVVFCFQFYFQYMYFTVFYFYFAIFHNYDLLVY